MPYEILATGQGCGILEFLNDSLSIDYIKRKMQLQGSSTLLDYYLLNYGKRSSSKFNQAVKNFCYSLSAYSLVCYVLQIKDRHNANILLDKEGHIIHIDFGYLLTNSPRGLQLENAPFKFTSEFVELMGGENSEGFRRFRNRFIQ